MNDEESKRLRWIIQRQQQINRDLHAINLKAADVMELFEAESKRKDEQIEGLRKVIGELNETIRRLTEDGPG